MAGVIRISGCTDSSTAMKAVAVNECGNVVLSGEPDFIGSAGEGNTVDSVLAHYGQDVAQTENDAWEYYSSKVSGELDIFLKAWLHWNGKEFDAYLRCGQDVGGESGFASHDMPYVR